MLASLRSTLRSLVRRRRFAGLFITLVALGAGAFGTIFALVNAALLRPLSYRDAARLYALTILEPTPNKAPQEYPASPAEFVRWRNEARDFDRIEGYWLRNLKLTGDGDPASVPGAAVSAGLFDLLGAQPVRGRAFQGDRTTRRTTASHSSAMASGCVSSVETAPRSAVASSSTTSHGRSSA